MITIVETGGSNPRDSGTRMFVVSKDIIEGTIGGGKLEKDCIDLALETLETKKIKKSTIPLGAKSGQCCGGVVEVLIEPFNLGPRLFIFGSGHIALATAKILKETPFKVSLIDERIEWLSRFDGIKYCQSPLSFLCEKTIECDDYVIVMTHSHQLDLDIIANLIEKEVKFIGLIGSETKWLRFQKELQKKGHQQEKIAKTHCPIGLPIGGKSPAEIAISIASQLIKIHYEK